jgi:ABC-type molybdate transport system ATPase subunit
MLTLPASDTTLVRDQDLPRGYLSAEENELARLGTTLITQQNGALKISNAVHRTWNSRVAHKAASWVAATHIGQVDAVLGKKQALEVEVQNLAQGRYPLSLFTELARSGLIDESMEYWPYDGEDWPDEVQ